MAKKQKSQKSQKSDDSKLFAFLATFLSIIGFVIALVAKKNDEYVMFYAKQSLVVFIVAVIGSIVNSILAWIPVFGWIVMAVINILVLLIWIFSWVNALSGEKKETFLVGQYARNLKF